MPMNTIVSSRSDATLWSRISTMTRSDCIDYLIDGDTANAEEFLSIPLEELRLFVFRSKRFSSTKINQKLCPKKNFRSRKVPIQLKNPQISGVTCATTARSVR